MNRKWLYALPVKLILFATAFIISHSLHGQVTSPGASHSERTSYPAFPENDPIFIFCASQGQQIGVLEATTEMDGEKNFLWDKFNATSGIFESYSSETTSENSSRINGLSDGCYRATIVSETGQEVYRAWVFNNIYLISGEVTESNCDFFTMNAQIESEELAYYDISTGQKVELDKDTELEWLNGEVIISRLPVPSIYNPPTQDTNYTLRVFDRFGCQTTTTVTYNSIVTKASFIADPMEGETPLTVTFSNTSENGDLGNYEWFFFKDLDIIKYQSQGSSLPIDSIAFVAYDDNPIYTYQNSGIYMVKLVSKKISEYHTCTDTVYLSDYIIADTSYIRAPNVFTPNGDGVNDNFVIKFWSMKEVKITIKNRWGRTVHFYQEKNVSGFENAWPVSAWDGRIGGNYASPGVYFYFIEGMGRDGKRHSERGFVHLFRNKD